MLTRVTPIEFTRPTLGGRTKPAVIICETPDGSTVEVVAKFSAGCDEREVNLAREAIAACLAGDLGLPIPEPFLIDIPPTWADLVSDPDQRTKIKASSPVAFGSRLMTGQYSVWNPGTRILDAMVPTAAAIFVFDAIIQNIDRRSENPNCLVRGDEIRIFDHELAFSHGLVIGWKPPWVVGGLSSLETPGRHIFRAGLSRRAIDFQPIRDAWSGLPDAQIRAYGEQLPTEWSGASGAVTKALTLIREARDNIDACLVEVKRVLG